jgi:hypothetical protein
LAIVCLPQVGLPAEVGVSHLVSEVLAFRRGGLCGFAALLVRRGGFLLSLSPPRRTGGGFLCKSCANEKQDQLFEILRLEDSKKKIKFSDYPQF